MIFFLGVVGKGGSFDIDAKEINRSNGGNSFIINTRRWSKKRAYSLPALSFRGHGKLRSRLRIWKANFWRCNQTRYDIFSLFLRIFFFENNLSRRYIYIYTRLDSTAFIFGFLPPKIRLFCRLVSLSSCGGGVIGSNRNVNPATDPAAPLISGDKEAGRKIGREGGGGYARDGRE